MSLVSSRRMYSGRVLDLDVDTVRFPDGSVGALEMIRHPGAAAVVPFTDDPRSPDPEVLLIRQFRHAADQYVWEIPAGPMVIRYTATIKNGEWHEVGDRVAEGHDPVRFFEMTLKRIGDTDWPAGNANPPK